MHFVRFEIVDLLENRETTKNNEQNHLASYQFSINRFMCTYACMDAFVCECVSVRVHKRRSFKSQSDQYA